MQRTETIVHRRSIKNSQSSQENTYVGVAF